MGYSDQYVIILRFFLYFKSATHFKILKFIHFFFSVRHRGEESTTRRFMLEDVARKTTLNTSVTDLKMPFTKLCRRWHIGPLQNYVDDDIYDHGPDRDRFNGLKIPCNWFVWFMLEDVASSIGEFRFFA